MVRGMVSGIGIGSGIGSGSITVFTPSTVEVKSSAGIAILLLYVAMPFLCTGSSFFFLAR